MSFILDALKKSERERQRTAVPGISDLPIVVHSRRSSPWATIGIAAMLAGAAALAWVWWQSPPSAPVATVAAPVPEVAPEVATPQSVRTPPPITATPPPATRSLASEVTRVAATQSAASATGGASSTLQAATSPTTSAARGTVREAPISIIAARASGMSVPELTLELLVYSQEPRQRFVYINAQKYIEGDTLSEGPRLIEIAADGAVLTYNGRTFLLPQN